MNISIVGTGYVGLVQGACFADTGNDVICMDIDAKKIAGLKKGVMPIYEPGLAEVIQRNAKDGRITFTTDLKTAVQKSEILFMCLPTPQSEDGSADLSRVLGVAEQLAKLVNAPKIVVSKSTVPVGTVDRISKIMKTHAKHPVDVVSNPEFLKEGTALQDSLRPDRVIVGTASKKAAAIMRELYDPFVRTGNPIIVMDVRSAELTKYAANAFLATKITFMNDLANLCDRVGADVEWIRKGIASDPRIGKQFLFPGVGYGGSCFPKDVNALVKTAEDQGHPLRILKSVDAVNTDQKSVLVQKILRHFDGKIAGKTFAVWGLAFKPQTDDMRDAPSLVIIKKLLELGAKIKAHDPVAIEVAEGILGKRVKFCAKPFEAVKGADALIIVTEWNEFRSADIGKVKQLLKKPVVFDGRNIYDPEEMRQFGFAYYGIGRAGDKN